MFGPELLAEARGILARHKASSSKRIDDAALHAAQCHPVIVAKFVENTLGGIIDTLSGANHSASKVGNYYNDAMSKLLNSTGSPAAQEFGAEEKASLQPMFDQQNQALAAKEAAMGITNSGAAKADYSNLQADQSRALAGAVAPLYSSAIGSYGNIAGAMPGAQSGAYQNAIDNFYNSVQMAATGVPGQRSTQSIGQQSPYGVVPGASATPGAIDVSGMPTNPYAPDYNPYSATG